MGHPHYHISKDTFARILRFMRIAKPELSSVRLILKECMIINLRVGLLGVKILTYYFYPLVYRSYNQV